MHYHSYVPWLSDEHQTESFDDLFSALDLIADELNRAAEFEYEGISALGDSEDYEGAYECFKLSNSLSAANANLRNTVDQYQNRKPRAPLYSGSDGDALL